MRYSDIRQLLETQTHNFVKNYNVAIQAISGQNSEDIIEVAYENVAYDPKIGTSYLKSQFVPNTKRPVTIGSNATELIRGLYVLTPYTPSDRGPLLADTLADRILNYNGFKSTSVIGDSQGSIIIEYTERNQGFLEAPWYYVPIFIAWRVFKQ